MGFSYLNAALVPLDKAPFVHWCGIDPHNEVYVEWETSESMGTYIKYGSDPDNLDTSWEDVTPISLHKVHLSLLSPDTRYYYRTGASSTTPSDELSSIRSFKTAPEVAKDFNVTFTSDTQQLFGIGYYNTVAKAIKNYGDTDFVSIAGDLAEDWDSQTLWNLFFKQSLYTDNIPLVPSPGNNDGVTNLDAKYIKYFGITENGVDVYYTFNWSTTQFVICQIASDSQVNPLDPQNAAHFAWLNQTLANGASMDYRVLIYHRNYYHLMAPIIEKYNVSVALFGHSHQYARSYYNEHTYVCMGNGATIQGTMIEQEPYIQASTNGAAFTKLFFNSTGIKLVTYTPTYDIMDTVFLQRPTPTSTILIPDKIIPYPGGV
jgi:hypothetical protein